MEAPTDAAAQTDTVVRPVRDVDAESLGRVHATCWHETYDHLISKAALENVSPKRLAELWTHWAQQGDDFTMVAALVDGEIVGFAGSGPARDRDAPRLRELYFIYLLHRFHGTGIGQKLFDAVGASDEMYLWVADDNPRAHRFYTRNGFALDGATHTEPFLGETLTEVRFVR
jgi:GNAT superfamily N-acetyltransferase